MDLYRCLILLLLVYTCQAGPIIAGIVVAVGEIAGEVAAAAVAGSSIAGAFGVGASAIWYGGFVVVNGALYYGTAIAGAGALAGGLGAGLGAKVTDKDLSSSIMKEMATASTSTSTQGPKNKLPEPYHMVTTTTGSLPTTGTEKPNFDWAWIYKLHKTSTGSEPAPTKRSVTTATTGTWTIPAPPGQPVSTLPPAERPSEVPAGVPEYNFRMCQYDIITMGQNKQSLLFDQPEPQSIRVDNIPATCMVLATVLLGNPDLGPHPVPMGASSLQWNEILPDTIDLIRQGFGLQPMNATTTAKV